MPSCLLCLVLFFLSLLCGSILGAVGSLQRGGGGKPVGGSSTTLTLLPGTRRSLTPGSSSLEKGGKGSRQVAEGPPVYTPLRSKPPNPLDSELFLACGGVYGPPDLEAIKGLIGRGASVSWQSPMWVTPLIHAAGAGHVEVVRELLGRPGVRLDGQDVYGATALISAARRGHTEVVKVLLEAGADMVKPHVMSDYSDALMRASRRGHIECVKVLLAAGATTETFDKQGRTPIMYAVQDNRIELLQLLLDHKANFEVHSNDGINAIIWAIDYKRTEAIEILKKNGANIY